MNKKSGSFKVFLMGTIMLVALVLLVGALSCTTATPTTTTPQTTAPQSIVPATAAGETVHIKFYHWWPANSGYANALEKALQEVKTKSGGRIDYTLYPAGSLFKPPDTYDSIIHDVADAGFFVAVFMPGRFPMTEIICAPIPVKDVQTQLAFSRPIVDQMLYKEFPDVKLLAIAPSNFALYEGNKPVHTLEDMNGLRLRTAGILQANMIKALGAEPVQMDVGDIYLAMQTGNIDGQINTAMTTVTYKITDVMKYVTNKFLGSYSSGIIMNKEFYEKVPADLKPFIDELGWLAMDYQAKYIDDGQADFMAAMAKVAEIYNLPPVEDARWNAVIKGVIDEYIAGLNAKGLPGTELLNLTKDSAEKIGGITWPY